MSDLSERRKQILKHLIEVYVASAAPVPSEIIARQYEVGISSATVRNELAALEEMGLVRHPHTSAGRVPTELGYRYFVEHVMSTIDPSPGEQRTIRRRIHQVESSIDRWGVVAAGILASAVRAASVVTLPLAPRSRVRSLEILSVQDDLGLLVLIIQSGIVRQELIHWDESVSREDLMQLSNRLSQKCDGCTVEDLRALAGAAQPLEAEVLRTAAALLEQTERQLLESLYFEGLSHVLDQPEFSQSRAFRPFVELIERTPALGTFLIQASAPDVVRIIIGSEHALDQMHQTSTVLARYGSHAGPYGVLAVLGPTRMAYWRAASMVRFMAGVLDVLVDESTNRTT